MPMPSMCKKAAMPFSRSSGPENRCKVCTRSSPSTHASVHTAGDLPASGACASGTSDSCKACTRSSPSTHASVGTAGGLPASGACASGTSDSHERRTGDSCTCSQYSRMCMQFTAATSVKVRCRHQTSIPCGNRRRRAASRDWPCTANAGWPCTLQCGVGPARDWPCTAYAGWPCTLQL